MLTLPLFTIKTTLRELRCKLPSESRVSACACEVLGKQLVLTKFLSTSISLIIFLIWLIRSLPGVPTAIKDGLIV